MKTLLTEANLTWVFDEADFAQGCLEPEQADKKRALIWQMRRALSKMMREHRAQRKVRVRHA